MLRPYLEKKRTPLRTPISVEAQVGSFLYYVSEEGRYKKPRMLSEFLELPFPELSEQYPMLPRHL